MPTKWYQQVQLNSDGLPPSVRTIICSSFGWRSRDDRPPAYTQIKVVSGCNLEAREPGLPLQRQPCLRIQASCTIRPLHWYSNWPNTGSHAYTTAWDGSRYPKEKLSNQVEDPDSLHSSGVMRSTYKATCLSEVNAIEFKPMAYQKQSEMQIFSRSYSTPVWFQFSIRNRTKVVPKLTENLISDRLMMHLQKDYHLIQREKQVFSSLWFDLISSSIQIWFKKRFMYV